MNKEALTKAAEKLLGVLKKYKYPLLILLLGLALLLLPFGKTEKQTQITEKPEETSDYAAETEEKLEPLLMQIAGAGEVRVMLTLERGTLTQYQTDTQTSTDTSADTTQSRQEQKTVILSTGSAYDEAAVATVIYPRFQGALIVCEGADSAAVRLNVTQAVAAVTGLGADKITVVKMK